MATARTIHGQIFESLGATFRAHEMEPQGAGHVMGTYRMGSDPKTSVVNPDLRSHDHLNLFMLGSGVFPTGGTANPTLTLVALALRSVDRIKATVASLPCWRPADVA